jgi:gliding motility-associated-like protein
MNASNSFRGIFIFVFIALLFLVELYEANPFYSLFLFFIITKTSGQGSGKALFFNGSSYVDLDTAFISLSFPVTITFWAKAPGNMENFPFSSNFDLAGYSGIRCRFNPTGQVTNHFGDGGGFSQYDRRTLISNNQITFNEWVHVTYILIGATNMSYYVNGIPISGYYAGSGGTIHQPNGKSSFGRAVHNSLWYYMNGSIDDFTIWNKALSQTEIRNLVCRRTDPNANQLLGYFDFDNPTANSVTGLVNGHTGTFGGNVATPISGASIGDTSYYAYPPPPTFNQTLSTGEVITIKNITNGTAGVQLYEVFSAPNSLNGLPSGNTLTGYFGIFLARTDNSNKTYQLEISNYSTTTQVYQRDANDDNTWSLLTPSSVNGTVATFSSNSYTSEYIVIRQQNCRVDLGSSIITCNPLSIWLKDQHLHPSKTYFWSTGTTGDSLLVTNPGIYFVQMDSLGCIQYDTIEVIAKPVLLDIGPDKDICSGDSIWVKDMYFSPLKNYLWNGTQPADSIKVGSTQLITVSVDSAGCSGSDSLQLTVNAYPPPVFDTLLDKCIEEPKVFSFPQGNYSFLWPDGSKNNYFAIDTQVTVTLITVSPCNDSTRHTLLITQNICDSPCHIFVPNSFTPNSDGVNDRFELGVSCTTTTFSFKIFNRWGTLVFKTTDPFFTWNGEYGGRVLSEGVYAYIMEYTSFGGEEVSENGMIHLIR